METSCVICLSFYGMELWGTEVRYSDMRKIEKVQLDGIRRTFTFPKTSIKKCVVFSGRDCEFFAFAERKKRWICGQATKAR